MRLDPITRAKKWLTIDETVDILHRGFSSIGRRDVFHFAYTGRLELSVILRDTLSIYGTRKTDMYKNICPAELFYLVTQGAGEELAGRAKNLLLTDLIAHNLGFSSPSRYLQECLGGFCLEDDDFFYELYRADHLSGEITLLDMEELPIELVCTPQALEAFLVSVLEPQETPQAPTISTDELLTHPNASAHLKALISAFNKFWRNADLADSETYPTNKAVGEWIAQQYPNISSTKVRQMAEMLRHEDTPSGRRPENSGGI